MQTTQNPWHRRLLSLLLALGMVLALALPGAAPALAETTYEVTVTPSAATASAGDTITITTEVYCNGSPVEDLAGAGLSYTLWLDYWADNGHGDGNSDAVIA